VCSYYDDPDFAEEYRRRDEEAETAYVEEQEREDLRKVRACPGTTFPDGTHCGEYGWHAIDCPMRVNLDAPAQHTDAVADPAPDDLPPGAGPLPMGL
jgi:hypothetical protein